ncbi:MAG: hypothetical protein ABIN01_12030 [Ferruginibacter sp.]
MKLNTSIKQLKAAFLLSVFALNTIVGFACAVGVDMGFNSKHHSEEEATEAVVHIHKDGKKHIHHEKKETHNHDKSHKHNEAKNLENSKSDGGNCCTNKVKQFQELDKSVAASQSIVHPIFFTAFVAVYYNNTLLPHTDVVRDIKRFVRSYHPPISDIRIAIQSFQI